MVATLTVGVVAIAACSSDPETGVLQAADTSKPEGEIPPFDRNTIVDSASFLDVETIDVSAIQRFLSKTPYSRPSFLETYQSNGVRASDAILKSARQYGINPIVFLVFAEATQGLVGERNYPFPPERVEYVFGCGCLQADNCLPNLAGFDRQVDCLGHALRTAIDDMKISETTASGWGPDHTSTTLDGVKVTPTNEVTAALYDRTPRVNEGQAGGTWIFWNIWNLYTPKLEYSGPVGSVAGRWIGEPCAVAEVCGGVKDAICATNYPDGLCTVACTGQCPSDPSKPETFCAKFPDGGYCFPVCNLAAPACRKGYTCKRVAGLGSGDSKPVCSPDVK